MFSINRSYIVNSTAGEHILGGGVSFLGEARAKKNQFDVGAHEWVKLVVGGKRAC
jgi:hypothetical protein